MPPKYLTLIRHAEGYHQLTDETHYLRDPPLTRNGLQQCYALHSTDLQPSQSTSPPLPPPPNLLVSSPLTRTLQTMFCSLTTLLPISPDLYTKIIPLALLQETDDLPCNTGRPVEALRLAFSGEGGLTPSELGGLGGMIGRIQWELLDPAFPSKEGIYGVTKDVLEERARQARKWLWEREEEHVVAVSHSGFLNLITNGHPKHWHNTEYHTYYFSSAEDEYLIKEYDWSKTSTGQNKTEEGEFEETAMMGRRLRRY